MRICFVGKGGSGKTTTAAQFSSYLQTCNVTTLAIDADLNQHLMYASGIDKSHGRHLGTMQQALYALCAGTNTRIDPKQMIKTTPPGNGSRIFRGVSDLISTLTDHNAVTKQPGLTFATVGPPTKDDIGIKCYHSKVGMVELLLNHLVDKDDDYVVVDMTAGVDAFASGLYDKFDMMVVVVEPTLQSINVFSQYKTAADAVDMPIYAIGNKVMDEDDKTFLQEHLHDDLIAVVPVSKAIKQKERGSHDVQIEEPVIQALRTVKQRLDEQTKDWDRYLQRTIEIHKKNAQSWANNSKRTDLSSQIDPEFTYLQ